MKKYLIFITMILISISIVIAGITQPLPRNLNLIPGKEATFSFQIQNIKNTDYINCSYNIKEITDENIIVKFNQNYTIIQNNSIKTVFGKASLDKNSDKDRYFAEFCVFCSSLSNKTNSKINTEICGLNININNLEFKNQTPTNNSQKTNDSQPIIYIIYIIAFLLIIILIFYLYNKNLNHL